MQIDWTILINWIVSGLIGLTFGVLGSLVTYRLERKRDETNWKRQHEEEDKRRIRKALLLGVDAPEAAINTLKRTKMFLENEIRSQREMTEKNLKNFNEYELRNRERDSSEGKLEVELAMEILSELKKVRMDMEQDLSLLDMEGDIAILTNLQNVLTIFVDQEVSRLNSTDSPPENQKTCTRCGKINSSNAQFCAYCGSKF